MLTDSESNQDQIIQMFNVIQGSLEELSLQMWGSYQFEVNWDPEQFLKAFSYQPAFEEDAPLLERCMRFLEMCVDVNLNKPLLFVNAKSFFTPEAFQELLSHVFFCKLPVLFLESWKDDTVYEYEKKIGIDQHFLEFTL